MTTLVLFNSEHSQNSDDIVKPGFDWGTGQRRTRSHSVSDSTHAPGTYLYTYDFYWNIILEINN